MFYQARLGNLSLWITILTSALLIVLPVAILYKAGTIEPVLLISLAMLPAILVICFIYRVTGYQLTKKEVIIKRRVGDFSIPLKDIQEIYHDSEAMKGSLRTFGNGGLFGFYGRFRNKKLGSFRAFVTSMHNAVVIKKEEQTFVLSPEKPDNFVQAASKNI